MGQLAFIVLSTDPELREEVARRLEATGHVTVGASLSGPDELESALRAFRADAVYADLSGQGSTVLAVLESAPIPRPALLLGGPADAADLILRAMRLGAREFFPDNRLGERLESVVDQILLQLTPPGDVSVPPARVVCVAGAKGGVGATFVACQLAASLQQSGGRVALVDLHPKFGDVALQLDLNPTHTIGDAARRGLALDASYVQSLETRHRGGFDVVSAPRRLDEADLVTAAFVERVLELLRDERDWIVADLAGSLDGSAPAALELADVILLVTARDVPTLSQARERLALLSQLGVSVERVHLLLNRATRARGPSERELERFLGRPPCASLPDDEAIALDCVNRGLLVRELDPGGRLDRGFGLLGDRIREWCGAPRAQIRTAPAKLARFKHYLEWFARGAD